MKWPWDQRGGSTSVFGIADIDLMQWKSTDLNGGRPAFGAAVASEHNVAGVGHAVNVAAGLLGVAL